MMIERDHSLQYLSIMLILLAKDSWSNEASFELSSS